MSDFELRSKLRAYVSEPTGENAIRFVNSYLRSHPLPETLDSPLTLSQLLARSDEIDYEQQLFTVEETVVLELSALFSNSPYEAGYEFFMDVLNSAVCTEGSIQDLAYEIVAVGQYNALYITISGFIEDEELVNN